MTEAISIHAPRTGSDETVPKSSRATPGDFNPRSPHGERHGSQIKPGNPRRISIHAPRTGSDRLNLARYQHIGNFNPRSPHGERHSRPMPRALMSSYFNPRSPHGERQRVDVANVPNQEISIHAPRTGSDAAQNLRLVSLRFISIHAPRTGSDEMNTTLETMQENFNPRSPHGERHHLRGQAGAGSLHFNPRSPHGERPTNSRQRASTCSFQSTLPARGATIGFQIKSAAPADFNPRSPHGERRESHTRHATRMDFNPRSPHGERPLPPPESAQCVSISIHAPRTGSDASQSIRSS